MRCRGCGYSLWNVPGRTCPECGRPFRPSEFRFRPNAVEFCCAGCGQQYYGTDPDGLPQPRAFDCVKCGGACELDAMVLRAAPGVDEANVAADEIPWTDRARLGWFKAYRGTVGMALTRPGSVGNALADRAESGVAMRFVLVNGAISFGPSALVVLAIALVIAIVDRSSSQRASSALVMDSATMVGWAGLWIMLLSLGLGLGAAFVAGLAWCVIRVTGGRAPWSRIWCASAYGTAPYVLLAIPLLGPYCLGWMAGTWTLVATGIAMAAATRESAWRVVAAMLAPVVLLAALVAGAVALAMWSGSGPAFPPAPQPAAAPAGDAP
jgi:hypothetical protein